jgi:threonine dehydrogenase-like Zn-dependent dehydrogenase
MKTVVEEIRSMSGGRGADVCVEAVGFEPDRDLLDRAKAVINFEKGSVKTIEACMSAVRRGRHREHCGRVLAALRQLPHRPVFRQRLHHQGGQAPVHKHIDKLLDHVIKGQVKLDDIITHHLPLSQAAHGYDIFKHKKEGCVKVVMKP